MKINYSSFIPNILVKPPLLFCFLFLSLFRLAGINAATPLKTDRWLEIDLYWFEHNDMELSVNQFWDRFSPLPEGVNGWKGVILNVGWISDYILEWKGDLNEAIMLPKSMKKYPWYICTWLGKHL
jgi:hypothetical protein